MTCQLLCVTFVQPVVYVCVYEFRCRQTFFLCFVFFLSDAIFKPKLLRLKSSKSVWSSGLAQLCRVNLLFTVCFSIEENKVSTPIDSSEFESLPDLILFSFYPLNNEQLIHGSTEIFFPFSKIYPTI